MSNYSPMRSTIGGVAADGTNEANMSYQKKVQMNMTAKNEPIKAFPTPSNAIGSILGFSPNTVLGEDGKPLPQATAPAFDNKVE